jgi:hypothetical protein
MQIVDGKIYAGPKELAVLLVTHEAAIRNWIKKGQLPETSVFTPGSTAKRKGRCFSAEYLIEAVRSRRPNTTREDIDAWVRVLKIPDDFARQVLNIFDRATESPATPSVGISDSAATSQNGADASNAKGSPVETTGIQAER